MQLIQINHLNLANGKSILDGRWAVLSMHFEVMFLVILICNRLCIEIFVSRHELSRVGVTRDFPHFTTITKTTQFHYKKYKMLITIVRSVSATGITDYGHLPLAAEKNK